MASLSFAPEQSGGRRLSLAEIDAVVSARLGPTRGLGNSQPACFNRQVAMYLAAHIGRWSTTVIGRFYNGRDHSTVCYGIQRIESLRDTDPEVDALLSELKQKLSLADSGEIRQPMGVHHQSPFRKEIRLSESDIERISELVAAKLSVLLSLKAV
jgi:hypothetical protein